MMRYYFDIQENDAFAVDEQGIELADLRAAQVEAANSLADMAMAMPAGTAHHRLAIEVRTNDGPVFKAAFIFELAPHQLRP